MNFKSNGFQKRGRRARPSPRTPVTPASVPGSIIVSRGEDAPRRPIDLPFLRRVRYHAPRAVIPGEAKPGPATHQADHMEPHGSMDPGLRRGGEWKGRAETPHLTIMDAGTEAGMTGGGAVREAAEGRAARGRAGRGRRLRGRRARVPSRAPVTPASVPGSIIVSRGEDAPRRPIDLPFLRRVRHHAPRAVIPGEAKPGPATHQADHMEPLGSMDPGLRRGGEWKGRAETPHLTIMDAGTEAGMPGVGAVREAAKGRAARGRAGRGRTLRGRTLRGRRAWVPSRAPVAPASVPGSIIVSRGEDAPRRPIDLPFLRRVRHHAPRAVIPGEAGRRPGIHPAGRTRRGRPAPRGPPFRGDDGWRAPCQDAKGHDYGCRHGGRHDGGWGLFARRRRGERREGGLDVAGRYVAGRFEDAEHGCHRERPSPRPPCRGP
ncbi:hypothetical protein GGQ63_001268 [Prosthecomicrobium pneumaticum]|uniref:Uncharacterized protein n=1 Tax=Prosthecomicrobium pneumaticum TaxID=81895 RepID=A0A7W9FK29_9HYPH|nr:hypothetical protein [Prosthecomicrobium pneumaticum]